MLDHFFNIEMNNIQRYNECWDQVHTLGFEEDKSATDISAAIRLLASAASEWRNELGVFVVSINAKQAFDYVTPLFF